MRLDLNNNHHHDHRTRQATNGSSPGDLSSPITNGSGSLHKHSSLDSETNGYHHTNGHASSAVAVRPNLEPFYGHNREEVTRILLQSLTDLGYQNAAKLLSEESGYALEIPSVAAFRAAVLSGQFDEAELLLFGVDEVDGGVVLGNGHHTTASPAWRKSRTSLDSSQNGFKSHGLPLSEGADISAMKFSIRQQKYLELLERRDLNAALSVLRNGLTPLKRDIHRLHALSSLIMCPTTSSLMAQASWDGAEGSSRADLLSELSLSISPSVMIPEHRLATLLTAVQSNQIANCRYHNSSVQPSLYTDHECSPDDFPLQLLIDLKGHSDEVWYLDFSHDGSMLATAGKDGLVCVYETTHWTLLHQLREHERRRDASTTDRGVCCVAFSPDDQYLISCSKTNEFAVVSMRDGKCVARADYFDYPVTSAAWLPDSQSFVIGTQGSHRPLGLYSLRASGSASSPSSSLGLASRITELHSFREPPWDPNAKDQVNSFRITDVAVSPTGDRLVATTTDNRILMYSLPTRQKIAEWQMDDILTSINFDRTGEEMLVNMHRGKVLLLSAEPGNMMSRGRDIGEVEVKCRYDGVVQDKFVIRSCFGGAGEGVVVSGSEDKRIYIWRRRTGVQVAALDAHGGESGTVNAVAWHPTDAGIFASAGDDRRVVIWAAAASMPANAIGAGASRTSLGLHV